ncbi:protein FAM177A1 isoform X2 [Hetaerina americana]|uniref:protein FAM177A1 isoform X2 n=1 Tax=Hetaerina americana TaxID=62018 RepID=UPI003A7F3704
MSSLVPGNLPQFSNISEQDNKSIPIPIKSVSNGKGDNDAGKTRRILHFCDGTLEECNAVSDEQDGSSALTVDPSTLSWGPWILSQAANAGSKTLQVVDYVGESLANFFGITTPKYQYEIDEYEVMCAEEEEEKKVEDLEMGGWTEGSSKTTVTESNPSYSTEVAYDGPIKLQPNTVKS